MPLSDLARLGPPPENDWDPAEGPIDDGIRELFPSDPDYVASIYIDADRTWGEAQLDHLQAEYAARFPGRKLQVQELSREALRYRRLSLFPEMERLFLVQGHVCDLEARRTDDRGQYQVLFERQQRDALDLGVFMLWEMLRVGGHDLGLWEPPAEPATPDHDEIVEAEIGLQLGSLLGSLAGRRGDRQSPIALVEHADLLLGCMCVSSEQRIHLAETLAPRGAYEAAQRVETCRALFGRTPEAIAAQVVCEVRNAAVLFDHRRDWPEDHAERLARGARVVPVTPGLVATWFSQVLAALRKVVWETNARGSSSVVGHALRRELAFHPRPIGAPVIPRAYRTATVRDYVERAADLLAERLSGAHGGWITRDQITADFTPDLWLAAALHGSTLDHDEPFEDPEADRELAFWIGALKRTGHGYLDYYTADRLLDLLDEPTAARERFFFSQFSEAVWLNLVEAAKEVHASAKILELTYTWCTDPAEPWGVRRTANLLAIRGPLLSFPTCEAAGWERKAQVIRDQIGFLAPEARPVRRRA
jgi:hypothetical protein